jgi:hypothetical protein
VLLRLVPAAAAALLTGAAYSALVATGQADDDELLAAHDALHELEERAHELEQSCDRG